MRFKNLVQFDCPICTPQVRFWTERRLQLHMKIKHNVKYELRYVTPPVEPKV